MIAIGDLDFELHRPVHCRAINDECKSKPDRSHIVSPPKCAPQSPPQQNNDANDPVIDFIENDEDMEEQKFCEIHVVSGFKSDPEDEEEDISPTRKSRRQRNTVNYSENDQTIQLLDQKPSQKKKSSKKTTSSQVPKLEDKSESDVIELFDFENEDSANDGAEEEEEGEGIVFDMTFDELSGEDSAASGEKQPSTTQKPKRFRGKKSKVPPKNIPCPDCKKMFRAERTLKTHRKRDHGFVQRNICTICGREFKDAGNLNQHMHTHGDSKRYICNFCGKGFHMPYNLKEHMHQHTGERPYKCSVCEKTFNRQTLRTAHMRVSPMR